DSHGRVRTGRGGLPALHSGTHLYPPGRGGVGRGHRPRRGTCAGGRAGREPAMKVLAAMSGGVDSALAAALAVEAGHDVTGVHMALSRTPGSLRTGSRGCCTVEDAFDARRVCDLLGIPFYIWYFSEEFQATVVNDF